MLSAVGYEELPWHIDPNERDLIPRSARWRMSATYQATIPAAIADLSPAVPKATSARIDDLLMRLALVIGRRVSGLIDGVMEDWRSIISERAGSAIWRLPLLLAEQPVVTIAYVAKRLEITPRAASTLVARACEYGMLRPLGSRRRGDFYQSDELIDVLGEISSMSGIRRMLAR